MTERHDQRTSREQNLNELASLGDAYLPTRYGPTRSSAEVKRDYEALEGSCVRVAGRLMRVRLMGKAAFAHIQDSSGQLQLYFKLDVLGPTQYQYFKLLDIGDIIGAEGTVFKTRTGEISVQVERCVLLAKSYLQLPDKFHGLSDVEVRYRRRYLDLIANEEPRRIFRVRSEVLRAVREFLAGRGFVEVETPTLQPIYGGGAAIPFVTHYSSLDVDVYLRIATELYLKRLLVGGFERVYEIGKDFRNEGVSRKHSPEFTMLELYQAYADYQDIMELTENLVAAAARHALGTQSVHFDGHDIDVSPPWRRLTVREAIREYAGVDITSDASRDEVLAIANGLGLDFASDAGRGQLLEEMISTLVEPRLIEPTILYDFPVDFPGSLLAKRRQDDPLVVERFEVYIGGMELANAFTELNDPRDQRQRMEEAAMLSGEAHQEVDADFLLALEYGMPPAGGMGIGLDRLVMILTGAHHIRETILFPLLRPQSEEPDAQP